MQSRESRISRTLHLALDRIERSEKLRAQQTAEILAARLRPTEGIREIPCIASNDDIEPMLVRLESETGKLMLVGHLPYLSRLASRLLGLGAARPVVQFQMGGVVCIERDDAGRWTVGWMLVPELLSGQVSAKPGARIGELGGTPP